MTVSRPHRTAEQGGFLVGAIVFVCVFVAIAVLAWMIFLPRVITGTATEITGFPTSIRSLHANPMTGAFRAEAVVMRNPETWGGESLAELKTLSGEIEVLSLRKRTLVVEALQVDLDRLVIVVDSTGRTNLEALGERFSFEETAPKSDLPTYATAGLPSAGEGPEDFVIRRLELRIGTLEIHDRGTVPARKIIDNIDYQYTYENIRTYQQLITPALMGELAKSPATLNLLMSSGLLGDAGNSGSGLKQLFNRAEGAVNSFLQGLEQTPKP